jgi:hypothetical protein
LSRLKRDTLALAHELKNREGEERAAVREVFDTILAMDETKALSH